MMGASIDVPDTAGRCAELLASAQAGDSKARDELFATLYEQWRQRAHRWMEGERDDHTLDGTEVLHEALIPILQSSILAEARSPALLHFAVSRGIEQALLRHARDRSRKKRGGDRTRMPLDNVLEWFQRRSVNIEGIARELEELASLGPENKRRCDVLRLKIYGRYSVDEIVCLLGMSKSTIEKDLHAIKAQLRERIDGHEHTKGKESRE
jgi:RNA polymerase sigma factor (TIGR02999 family)